MILKGVGPGELLRDGGADPDEKILVLLELRRISVAILKESIIVEFID